MSSQSRVRAYFAALARRYPSDEVPEGGVPLTIWLSDAGRRAWLVDADRRFTTTQLGTEAARLAQLPAGERQERARWLVGLALYMKARGAEAKAWPSGETSQ